MLIHQMSRRPCKTTHRGPASRTDCFWRRRARMAAPQGVRFPPLPEAADPAGVPPGAVDFKALHDPGARPLHWGDDRDRGV